MQLIARSGSIKKMAVGPQEFLIVENQYMPTGQIWLTAGKFFGSPATIAQLKQENIMGVAVKEAVKESATAEVDLIVEVASEIEQLDAEGVFTLIPELLESVDSTYFKLGCALAKLSEEGWWKNDDYDSFRSCIEDKFGLHYRKAMYLMNIANSLIESEIPWMKVAPIGWTKLKEIADILTTENVDEWVAKIVGPPPMTVLQIQEAVKAIKVGSLASTDAPDETSTISSISFKVHADQKENIKAAVAKAKGEAETEFDGVALDAICMNYLSGGKAAKPKALSDVFKAYQPEEVLEAFAVNWPDIDVKASM